MIFLATHIGIWLLAAFALGLIIGWFLWGQWVGIDMNRDFAPKAASNGEATTGSISVLSDSLLKTQRELERCQQSLASAEARLGSAEIRYNSEDQTGAETLELPEVEDEMGFSHSMNAEVAERDDLKKIKGIGPVIERKLAELDIVTYRQIALLNPESLEIVSEHINYFTGRIERDGWLESARELHIKKYGEDI